ncbi:TadE family protein [Angustibacter aerolatus]
MADAPDAGAAVVDFALVGALVTLLFTGLVQLTLVLHVRATLIDCAAEGARYGARADRSPADAVDRTRSLVSDELTPWYEGRLDDRVRASAVERAGVRVVEVEVTAPLPLVGLLGPTGQLTVRGHAFAEAQ